MKITLLAFAGIIILLSCEKNAKVFDPIDSFPVSPGCEWIYTSESLMKIFESSSSNKVIDVDTVRFSVRVKIEKDTLLNDTMNVKQFVSTIDKYGYISKQYYYSDASGLKAYAYSHSSSHSFARKNVLNFNPIDFLPFGESLSASQTEPSIIVIQPAPRLNLKFPLEINSAWTYAQPFEPLNLQINKKVIGYEFLRINNLSYPCYIVSWIYLKNSLFDGTKIYDWISKDGLIKRQITYERTNIESAMEEGLESVQITETILLNELSIIE